MHTLHRLNAAVLATLGVLVLSACDDAPEFRVITLDSASSTCIGDPKTPECAVETILACNVRRNGLLCEIATRRAGGLICRHYPDLYFCEFNKFDFDTRDIVATAGRERRIVGLWGDLATDPLLEGFFSELGAMEEQEPIGAGPLYYRITRIGPVQDETDRRNQADQKAIPNIALIEVDVERWICGGGRRPPSPTSGDRDILPADTPGSTLGHWVRASWRRLETILWEYGIAEEPFRWVWYGVGKDYCWQPQRYWVGSLDGLSLVMRWSINDEPNCESRCGCPDFLWPGYRKVYKDPLCENVE